MNSHTPKASLLSMSLILCFSIIFQSLVAQTISSSYFPTPDHPNWFKAIPAIDETTPEWAIIMYTEDSNFEKIERLKNEFYRNHPFEKNIHIQNYKHWYKLVNRYIDNNGQVNLPAPGQEFLESQKKIKKSSTNKMMDTWSNIGPYETINFDGNGSQYTRPTQANAYCLAIAESNPNTLYAGMETGGMFKTIDKGLSWFPVTKDYAMGNIHEIKIDPINENIVYAVHDKIIYKSIDSGTTWNLHHTFSTKLEQMYIHKTNTDTLYAATQSGVFKSVDAGSSWTQKFTGRCYDIEAKPGVDSVFYIAVENTTLKRPEIFKSIDSGDTWVLMDNGYYMPSVLAESTVYGCKIGVTPADPNRLYAGIIASGKAGDNGWIGIYYSLDEGVTWQEDSGFDGGPYVSGNDVSTNWYVGGYSSGYHQGFYNFDLDVSHNNPDKLWVGTIWFCESGNRGGNIEYIRGTRSLGMHADVQDIDVLGNDIWVASDGGINYSQDEFATTETRMSGITASDYWGFGQGWNEDTWVGGRYHNGNAAYHENYGAGKTLFMGGAESATGYVNQFNNKKNYHNDIGGRLIPNTFTENSKSIPDLGLYPTQAYYHFSYSEVEWHPYYGNTVYVGRDNVMSISLDAGTTFDTLFTFPDLLVGSTLESAQLRRFEVSRDDPDYIYCIVFYTTYTSRIYKSTDGGSSFIELPQVPISGGSWRNLSIALNPWNKNELWVGSYNSSDGNKIFSSEDGGMSYTNRYSSVISGENIKDIIYQKGITEDHIYVMTNDDYFYYNKTSGVWTQWNDGLPAAHKGFMTLPFYRDNKIRMASAKGIWEAEMINPSKVQAIPMSNIDSVFCSRDTVQLESYSIAAHTGTSWQWSISPTPAWISDINARNPQIVLGAAGNYDVGLTVTDINGQTDSRTVNSMIHLENRCIVDSVAGMALQTYDNGDYLVASDVNLSNITHFTVTGWWKPEGVQQAYAALVSSGDWCAHCEDTEGLIFNYYGDKLWYKWPGEGNPWASSSGIDIPLDEWSYVALVIEPTGATLYLNDEKYVHTRNLSAGDISSLYVGYGHYSKSFKGKLDEITIWNRALSDDEVYRMRHITKEDQVENDPDIIAYYQFNETFRENQVLDISGNFHGALRNDAELSSSTVPVGKGVAQIIDLSSSQYKYDFIDNDMSVYLSSCESPQGKLVATRLDVLPDTIPNQNIHPENYWTFDYYGDSFVRFDSVGLSPKSSTFLASVGPASSVAFHSRTINGEGFSWGDKSKAIIKDSNTIIFDRKVNVTDNLQVFISKIVGDFPITDPGSPCEVDTIPDQALVLPGNSGNHAEIPAMDLNSNTITFSAWVKPEGIQNSWAGIIFSRAGNTTAGISCASNNELRYHWAGGQYGWSSGAYLPADEWSHVAMVIEPSKMTIYLNGVAYTRNATHAIEEFDGVTRIGNDPSSGSRTFKGLIDEVCIWNRVLSTDEVRLLRHLTKENEVLNDPDLVAYLQFNEASGKAYDKSGSKFHTFLNGSTSRSISSAPVGGGTSDKLTVTAAGTYTSNSGLEMIYAGGSYPNGDLVISRINLAPNSNPNTLPISKSYWIANNYGTNSTFTGLTEINVKDIGNTTAISLAADYRLFFRGENSDLAWTDIVAANQLDIPLGNVDFSPAAQDSLGQFVIVNQSGKGWIGIADSDWSNTANWADGFLPKVTDQVIIPANTPFHPIVNIPTTIKNINLMPGAYMEIPLGIIFETK